MTHLSRLCVIHFIVIWITRLVCLKKSISENQQIDWERELSQANDRVENLKSIAERGMDELKEKKKSVCRSRKTIETTAEIEHDARVTCCNCFSSMRTPFKTKNIKNVELMYCARKRQEWRRHSKPNSTGWKYVDGSTRSYRIRACNSSYGTYVVFVSEIFRKSAQRRWKIAGRVECGSVTAGSSKEHENVGRKHRRNPQ